MPIAKFKILVQRAVEAATAAIEIYNKPGIQYREELFSILMLTAWELLLKARVVQQNKGDMRVINDYEYKKKRDGSKSKRKTKKLNRSGNPMTIGLLSAANLVRNYPKNTIDDSCINNLLLLQEIRDNSIHFLNVRGSLAKRVHEVGSAALQNFVVAVESWFGVDVRHDNFCLIPLSFNSMSDVIESLGGENEPQHIRKLLNLISKVELESVSDQNEIYNATIQINLNFVRKYNKKGTPVQIDNVNPNAIPVRIEEDEMLANFPWNYAELNNKLKSRYVNFKLNQQYHNIRKAIESEMKFCKTRYLDPKKRNGGTNKKFYNSGILSEFDKHYEQK